MQRVTVNLVPRAADALDAAAERTGDNKTDVINRALGVWVVVLDALERSDGRLTVVQPGGDLEHFHFL